MDKQTFLMMLEAYTGPVNGKRTPVNLESKTYWLKRMCAVVLKELHQQVADDDLGMAAQTQELLNSLLVRIGQLNGHLGPAPAASVFTPPAPRTPPPVRRPTPPQPVDDAEQFMEAEPLV
jgi:hypothetical protein